MTLSAAASRPKRAAEARGIRTIIGDMRGYYCLVMQIHHDVDVAVGRSGRRRLPAGFCVYCGSALGPGGVEARLARHLRSEKRLHWHIDYLLPHATALEAWAGHSQERLECLCADCLRSMPGAASPLPRFGASDCRCPGHLVWLPYRPQLQDLDGRLRAVCPGVALRDVPAPVDRLSAVDP